jgi:DNA uptake protein ComE-like DNA-binding protein
MSTRHTYIPALSVIVLLSVVISVFVIWDGWSESVAVGKSTTSRQNIEVAQKRLDNEKKQLTVSQDDSKLYEGYFSQWEQKEKVFTAAMLLERLQKLAEESSVTLIVKEPDTSASSPATPANLQEKTASARRITRPSGRLGMVSDINDASDTVSQTLVVRGPFDRLLNWMEQAETNLGGLRITGTTWTAKSREEVELQADIVYKTIRRGQP